MRTPCGRDVKVAVLGLTNPGIAIWDKANVQGKMAFPGLEEQAAKWVPKLRSMGADVVIVSAHSGSIGYVVATGTSCRTWRTRRRWWRSRCRGSTRSWWGTRTRRSRSCGSTNKETGKDGGAVGAAEVGAAADAVRLRAGVGEGRWSVESVKVGAGAELEHGGGGPADHVAAVGRAREGGGVREPGDRYVDGGDVDGGGAVQGRADHRSDQSRAGGDGEGGAGGHGVRGVAGAVAGVVLLADGGDPGG